MRMPALVLILVATTLLTAPARAQDKANPPPQQQIEQATKKTKELQQERIAVLKEVVAEVSNLHGKALASIDELYDARLAVIEAELEAAAQDSSRVALYKNMVGLLTEYEHLANEMRKSVGASGTVYLKIKARRLEAEIKWEQAKAKEAQAGH